jgi:hypothetical protein
MEGGSDMKKYQSLEKFASKRTSRTGRKNPNVVGQELVYRIVKRGGPARSTTRYYVEGLPPHDKEKMLGALYDLWQVSEELEKAGKPYDRIVFVTPHGKFMTESFHVVEDTPEVRKHFKINPATGSIPAVGGDFGEWEPTISESEKTIVAGGTARQDMEYELLTLLPQRAILERADWPGDVKIALAGKRAYIADIDDGDLFCLVNDLRKRAKRSNPRAASMPPGAHQARKTFEGFNDYASKGAFKFKREIVVPEMVPVPGPCRWVTYKSDKWNDGTYDYIHTISSYPKVKCGMIGEDYPKRRVPAKVREAKTLSQIGLRALGFAFERDGDEFEAKLPKGTEWFWSKSGRALYLIHGKSRLVAIIWGGKLDVEPRGIVG